ncbi:P protein-like [Drosophila innubila]|uniref:P protein-like n=1 Tax=Drosophila innubila TaxID=198719 RepID=UPI00148C058B|nr:P protein-like [Drosophila innubila]
MACRIYVARRYFFADNTTGLTEEQLRRRALRKSIFTIVKLVIFLIIWMSFTIYIILTPSFEPKEMVVPLPPKEKQIVMVDKESTRDFIGVDLRGNIDVKKTVHPKQASENDPYVIVAVEAFNIKTDVIIWKSKEWRVYIDESDLQELHTVKNNFALDKDIKKLLIKDATFDTLWKDRSSWRDPNMKMQVTLLSLHKNPLGFVVNINPDPINTKISVWLGLLLLIFLYVMICFDITDRTFASLMAATSAIGILCFLDERPSLSKIIGWMDMETLMLLFGMMVMVSIISDTGIFDYLSVIAYQLSKGKIWRLLFFLYMFTGIVSAFLDNVTIVLLMVPVTIRLCEVLAINTTIVLISVAIFSNIGGTLTPVGDPPNVIIATNEYVRESGINFGNFMLHMLPGVVISMLLAFLMIYFMTRNKLKESGDQLRRSIEMLEAQAEKSKDTQYNPKIVIHIAELKERLKKEESLSPTTHIDFEETLKEIKSKHKIRDVPLLIKCCIAFVTIIMLFLFCSIPDFKGIMLGWAAILAALLLLILADKPDVDSIIERVEWSTLVFFAALFVLMEALVDMGLIDCISDITTSIVKSVDKSNQLTVGILLVLWISAISSALVDNIPITTLMLKLTIKLATNDTIALPLQPLVWALSFGACFGGNGTLIGASANVVTAGIAKQHGYEISFLLFFIIGFPIMIMTVVVSTIYLFIAHHLYTWN